MSLTEPPNTFPPLFKHGVFTSHSGLRLRDKIDCDALTKDDWDAVAAWFARKISFQHVVGIPMGGRPFEQAMKQYEKPDGHYHTLIVDDVLTTGKSMFEYRDYCLKHIGTVSITGAVLFSRTRQVPWWITARFVEQGEF